MRRAFYLILSMLLLAGCERAPEPVPFSGTVTLDGRPIAMGRIQFAFPGEPPEPADIVDGKFAGKALPGKRRVEIYGFRPIGSIEPNPTMPQNGEPIENYLPDKFNAQSTLTQEIANDGQNILEFKLTTQP